MVQLDELALLMEDDQNLGLHSASAAHGPKESTTLPGAGNRNLEGKNAKAKLNDH